MHNACCHRALIAFTKTPTHGVHAETWKSLDLAEREKSSIIDLSCGDISIQIEQVELWSLGMRQKCRERLSFVVSLRFDRITRLL